MSLQGTLRTLGITEVLEFLADRSATGRLDITADSGSATYWMLRGEVADVGYDFERESGTDAAESTYYALSELDGTFFFDEGEAPEHGTPTESVADVLGRTADIAEGWSIVEEFIPSPLHQLVRSDSLDGSVTIEPAWWQAIEAIGSGCSSRSMADTLGMRALAASTMAADMARVGLIRVEDPLPEPTGFVDEVEEIPAPVDAAPVITAPEPVADESSFLSELPPPPSEAFAAEAEQAAVVPDMFAEPIAEPPAVEPTPIPDVTPIMDAPADDAWPAAAPEPEVPAPEQSWDTASAASATDGWDVISADTPAAAEPAPVADVAPASWDQPAAAPAPEPAADGWGNPPEAAPAWDTAPAATAPSAPAAPVAAAADDDDGWATDHSAAAPAAAPASDAAAALASWGVQPSTEPQPAAAPDAFAEPAPETPTFDPFADLPSEAEVAPAPAPAPAHAPAVTAVETAPAEQPGFQAPPSQAAVFGSAPPAASPYAPDAAPPGPGTIAPPAGTVEQLASLEDLDDEDDEAFATDDRSSVLKFLRRD